MKVTALTKQSNLIILKNKEEEKTNKNNNIFDNNIIDNNNDNKEIIKDIDIENKEKENKIENVNEIENTNENIFETKEDNGYIKLDPELISRLFKKINDLEKKINQINSKTTKDLSPKIKSNFDNINNIKVKVEDFNIYDIFKGDASNGGNVDVNNALIQALEKKVFKKFELYDEKNKKNEEDLFKASENIKNLKGLNDNMKNIVQKNSDKIKELENYFNDYKNVINKSLDEIRNNFALLENKLPKSEIKIDNSDFEKKLNEIEEKLNKLLEKPKEQVIIAKDKDIDSQIIKKIEEFDNLIKEMNKSINHLEKNMNKKISEENKIITDKLSLLGKELEKKADLKELSIIDNKIYNLEEIIKVINSNLDSLQQYNEKFKSDINSIFKKMEYFDGEIFKLKDDNDKNSLKKYNNIESGNFLPQTTFNIFKKDINTKLEKIKADLDNLNNNIDTLSSSLNHRVSNKEFSKFQKSVINLIDDFKSSCHKKYMDKTEIHKSLKNMILLIHGYQQKSLQAIINVLHVSQI